MLHAAQFHAHSPWFDEASMPSSEKGTMALSSTKREVLRANTQ
jgi:hypothetical protein